MRLATKPPGWPACYIGFRWARTPAGIRLPAAYKGHIRTNTGSFIPFARTKAERIAAGDLRPSLEERYGTHEKCVALVRAAAERMVRERFLLEDDADRLISQAEPSSVLNSRSPGGRPSVSCLMASGVLWVR